MAVAVIVGFTINETMVVIAQPNGNISRNNKTALNSTDSDGKNIAIISQNN